jgi:hypothetical protein
MNDEPEYKFLELPELSEWKCYMFGSKPSNPSFVYRPIKGGEPNWFVRWMMLICFNCTWIKENETLRTTP